MSGKLVDDYEYYRVCEEIEFDLVYFIVFVVYVI